MKILFAGPTLSGLTPDLDGITLRPPARLGDIADAVLEGAAAIGLVDGYFDAVAAPWHKEILYALASGVNLLGSSSMGALRAAECAAFGMRPIGAIALAYLSGALDDDAAVALCHGPAELGYPPLTEPLVTVAATLDHLLALGLVDAAEHGRLVLRAQHLNFRDRTVEALFAGADSAARTAYRLHRVDSKARDALQLIEALRQCPQTRGRPADIGLPATLFTTDVLPALERARQAA
ncbi:TfuA-like protein [Devosia sp.]|uniref:TfuA-like protein n=1 Tax=Devosia sp. TaxID=1871048 RepID=UPI0035B196FC